MKNHGKRLLRCLAVMVLSLALAAMFIPISANAAAGNANGTISRVEWLRGLIGLFDMTVEEDNYPDNYFSDISSADSCYRDIMVATEFGLVDVEEGFDMRPDDPVTREFAAYTMNVCLGYVLEEADTYTFSDQDAFTYFGEEIAESYYQAAQVALNRGWMTLVNGTFAPQTNLTQEEKSVMWSDAQESIASKVIDKNYDNKVTFAQGVIEVPEGTEFELEEYDTGTFVTLFHYNGLITDGDTFALWVNGLPAVYKAVAVEDMGDSLVIQITEGDENSAIQELDAQGTAEADLATAVQEGEGTMTWIAGGTEEKNYEDGREVRDPRAAGSVPIKAIKRSIPIKLQGGLSATLNVTVPKPKVNYKVNGIKEVYVALNADTTVSATVKGNMIDNLGLPRSINIVYIPIGGIGEASISVSVAASGQCSVNYNFDAVAGIHYRKGNGTSLVSSFKKKSFTVSAQAELSATLSATLGVTKVPKVNASIWAKIGPRMGLSAWTYGDGKKPAACMDTYGYVYAGAGATLRIFGKDFSPRPYEIWTKQNSPVRVAAHYEDGVRTSACTRDASQRRYYTRDTSKYFSDGSGIYDSTGSSGSGTVIQPRYEYTLEKNDRNQDVATITKYYGSVSAIVIPNTIDGYPVVAIGYRAFERNNYLQTVLIPDSITVIEQEAFVECTNLETVTLPSNLERLDGGAFYNNDMLTSIEIPKSLKESFDATVGPFNSCDRLKDVSFEQGTTKIISGLFANCPGIESIIIPDTVTDIESYAFYGSRNLREVTLPNSITSISWKVFEECTSLTNVKIPNSVTVIEGYAFAECTNLQTVTLSSNLERLDGGAFSNNVKLTSIEIPKSLKVSSDVITGPFNGCDGLKSVSFEQGTTKIMSGLLANCPGIESIVIPDTVTDIESYAFYGSRNLREVTMPESITSIDWKAFEKCTGLTNIKIPNSVTVIMGYAFAECTNLETVTLSSNLERLDNGAFYNNDMLTSIEIPKSLKESFDATVGPFNSCDGLKNVSFEQGTTKIISGLFANCPGIESIVIPDTVTDIESYSFYGSRNLREVTMPDSITSIGWKAFEECTGLTNVKIPNSVTVIEGYAFAECTNLETVTLPSNLERLDGGAFSNNDMLTSIEIPKSLKESFDATVGPFNSCDGLKNISFEQGTTKITSGLLANCLGIESIVIPDTVTDIESYAFYGSKNLRKVTMPDSITSIGWSTFADCTNLESIQLPDFITDITDYMFQNCTALKNIDIPKRITQIGSYALDGCTSLEKVTIQDAKTYIGSYAFRNCTTLTEMNLGKEITEIGDHAFYGCDALSSIVVPDSVTRIGGYCFEDCDVLQNVSLGTGITEIPEGAFYQCGSLEKIVLPYRVSRIRTKAFVNCTKLTSITIPRSVTAIDDNVFSYPGKMTIYGVSGTYAQTYAKDKGISFVSNEVHAKSVALSSTTLKLNKGNTAILALAVEPADFTDEVTWKSTDTSVAAIRDSGVVTAKGVGTATIRVIVGNISADCKVTVGQPVTSISLNEDYLSLEASDTYQLTASVYPTNADNKGAEWISSDETVASVDQTGLVTALSKGEATITALAKDGSNQSGSCTVTVKNTMYAVTSAEKMESPHGYENNCSDIWVYTDENAEDSLEVVFDERTEVEDGFDFIYIYSADGTQIGKYTGTQLSGATVEVPGNTVKIKLVSDEAGNAWGFKVNSIHAASGRLPQKISGASAYTKVYGDSKFPLDCQITEGNGTLSYVSDNGEVVSADEKGNITIHGAGTATVTAIASMTADYRKTEKRITITVNKARQNLAVSSETNEIHAGQSLKLHVVSKTGVLRFSSDKEEVVKVDQEGNAVGQAAGTANITVTAVGNKNYLEETKQITISVTAARKKRDNTIRANDITKTYSAKVRKVSIGAEVEDGAKLSYVSNNKSVKVDSNGKITIAKKFIGRAKITIRSASTQKYNAALKTIEITVNPLGTSIKKVKNTGKKIATVYWKKSGAVTGYEVQYSTNKKFTSGVKSKTVKKKGTDKLVLPKLKKGKTYFVRIRTYKTVSKEKYYSSWSKAKSVKIKR